MPLLTFLQEYIEAVEENNAEQKRIEKEWKKRGRR